MTSKVTEGLILQVGLKNGNFFWLADDSWSGCYPHLVDSMSEAKLYPITMLDSFLRDNFYFIQEEWGIKPKVINLFKIRREEKIIIDEQLEFMRSFKDELL